MRWVFRLVVVSLFLGLSAGCGFFGGGFAGRLRSGDPLHIRISFEDEKDHSLLLYGRMVIYPEQRVAALCFVNTQARTDPKSEPFRKGFGVFGDPMKEMTGRGHDFSLTLRPSGYARFIDLLEGIDFFVEDAVFLKGERFQYPDGVALFSGAQALEYSLADGPVEKGSEYLGEIDRMFRSESVLLNVFWQLQKKFKMIDNDRRMALVHSLVETDMSRDQLHALLGAFAGDHPLDIVVVESPLELGTLNGQKILLYKKERQAPAFQEFEKTVGQKVDGFPVQVVNGTDINRLASKVKDLIHNRGVRVLNTDNYRTKDFPHSTAIEHSGDFRKGKLLEQLLALPMEQVFFRRRAVDLHATIIMGQDFNVKNLLNK